MNRQITRKLDHAKGKLRDKASIPDYRERFKDEGNRFDRGGTRDTHALIADFCKGPRVVLPKLLTNDKLAASRILEFRLRSLPLRVDGYLFAFNQTPSTFAQANGLSLQVARQIFPGILADAEKRLLATKSRLLKAEPYLREEPGRTPGTLKRTWYVTFRTFLPTDQPQPWHKFFRDLRIDPVLHEPEPI